MKKYIFTIVFLSIVLLEVKAQTQADTLEKAKMAAAETDLRKTASSKEILTSLVSASIENILGNKRDFNLSFSFFAIDSIFRKKGKPLDYERARVLKNNAVDLGFAGGDNKIKKLSGGVTFTILDKRDIKSEKSNKGLFTRLFETEDALLAVTKGLQTYYAKDKIFYDDIEKRQRISEAWNKAGKTHDFSKVDSLTKQGLANPGLIALIPNANKKGLSDAKIDSVIQLLRNGKDPVHFEYQRVAKRYAQRPLWTIAPNASYNRELAQGEFILSSNFTVGISKKDAAKPLELELKSQFKISNDTTLAYSNYNDKPFSISLGANKVLWQNKEGVSKMEFKFFTQYNHQFGTAAANQKEDIFTLNTTLRVNLYKSLWLPVTLKYDVEKGNVLGLFTLTANIDN